MRVPLRTKTIASLVKENSKLIDVGCDHALLDIYLVQTKKMNKIIASDININALKQGKKNIEKYKFEDKIILRLGNGLAPMKNENIDTIVISGMGGQSIVNILMEDSNLLKNVNHIILQPNNKVFYVRKKICSLGFYINDEKLIEDNDITYTIISFNKGHKRYSYKDLYFGPILLKEKSNTFIKYYTNQLNNLILLQHQIPKKHFFRKILMNIKIQVIKNILKR
jgi:tRNA (adenine22-N1)-methyltransferase